jgi:methionyl-tRNA synthetase
VLARRAVETADGVDQALQALEFRTAAEAVLHLAGEANGFLSDQAPWKRMKQEGQREAVAADLYAVLETCRWVAVLLTPFVPDLAGRMLAQLAQPPLVSAPAEGEGGAASWSEVLRWGALRPGTPLPAPEPVMRRLELDAPL